MRGVFLQVPEWLLEERRQKGHDRFDEVWDGVLHMPPPPALIHQTLETALAAALIPIARCRDLKIANEAGLYGPFGSVDNYRQPDITLGTAAQCSERGFEGAEVVIEILSPHDESRDKFPFYAKVGVREIWLLEPKTRELSIHALVDGTYVEREPTRSVVLDIELAVVDGKLQLRDGDYLADV